MPWCGEGAGSVSRENHYLPGMRKFCFCLLFFVVSARAAAIDDTAGMRQEIMAILSQQPQASFAVAFEDLSTGQQFFINERESFHAASTMKTPVLIETFRLISQHQLTPGDSILI